MINGRRWQRCSNYGQGDIGLCFFALRVANRVLPNQYTFPLLICGKCERVIRIIGRCTTSRDNGDKIHYCQEIAIGVRVVVNTSAPVMVMGVPDGLVKASSTATGGRFGVSLPIARVTWAVAGASERSLMDRFPPEHRSLPDWG